MCEFAISGGLFCGVELDDILVNAEGKDNSMRVTQLAISILESLSFKINFSKSVLFLYRSKITLVTV